MHRPFEDSPEFERLITGTKNVHLARIALELARDAYPELEIASYLGRIDELVERIRRRCPSRTTARQVLGQVNWALFIEEEMRGNLEDYHDPRNSYLNEVLDRRLGIPISLSVLYWSLAERLGLTVAGANFPHHFMLRVDDGDQTWFIDAFHSGSVIEPDECQRRLSEIVRKPVVLTDDMMAGCTIQSVVTRMLRNLKMIYLGLEDVPSLLPVQRRLTALNPGSPQEQFDLGFIYMLTDRPGEAIRPLQAYLDSAPPAKQAKEVSALLESARRRVAEWN
jgi:regulator of sirC expression with transglutaminase-like and TPR domain